MRSVFLTGVIVLLTFGVSAQDVNTLLDRIHDRSQERAILDSTRGDYSYKQYVHFVKMDGDGEIEEQSERKFEVLVDSTGNRSRQLLSGRQFEDGEWTDITEEEQNKKKKGESKGVSFSLDEMVGPEARRNYQFRIVDTPEYAGFQTIRLNAKYYDEDEDHFNGDLWIDKESYNVVHAELMPSDYPTGVDSMSMKFNMTPFNGVWMPSHIEFEAEISFLFIFNGHIKTDIVFSDYVFTNAVKDSIKMK